VRNLLALVGLAVIGFGGAGWYLGWYKLSYARTPDGQLQINTTVNTKKAEDDLSEKLRSAGSAISNNVEHVAKDAKASAPASAPGTTQGPVVPPQALPEVPLVPGPTPTIPPAGGPKGPIQLIPPRP
jgi:hypothetical protein